MVVAAQGIELVGEGQGALQPGGRAPAVLRKRVEREEQGGGIKRRGRLGGASQAGVKRRRQRQRKSAQGQTGGKWHLKGFSTSPGGTKPVVGKYTVGAVESQVWVKGATSTEIWLGVKLARSRGGVTGWMHSGELQRRVGDDSGWREKLRGRGREGWMVQRHRWESNGEEAVVGRGRRGDVLGWCLPVDVVVEKALIHRGRGEVGGADEKGCSGQINWSLFGGSGHPVQEGVVQAHHEQEGVGGDHREAGTCR